MSIQIDSQNLETYVPIYDVVPEKWEEARPFLVEQLKKITNAVNAREVGFFLDTEVLSGKAFIPSPTVNNNTPAENRSILRIVVNCSPLGIGLNTFPHGITVDANFTLMQLYAAATNHGALTSEPIPNGGDTITLNATNINITVAAVWDTCFTVIEYIQEL